MHFQWILALREQFAHFNFFQAILTIKAYKFLQFCTRHLSSEIVHSCCVSFSHLGRGYRGSDRVMNFFLFTSYVFLRDFLMRETRRKRQSEGANSGIISCRYTGTGRLSAVVFVDEIYISHYLYTLKYNQTARVLYKLDEILSQCSVC